jgi:hypothetical protein
MSVKTIPAFGIKNVFSACLFVFTIGWFSSAIATVTDDVALRNAASAGDTQAVLAILSRGADVNGKSPDNGGTALMLAAMGGKREMAEMLISNGAEVNAISRDGNTALMFTALFGHRDVMQLLLEHGADTKIKNKQGGTALMISSDKPELVALLKQSGEGVTSSRPTNSVTQAVQDFAAGEAAYKAGNVLEAASWYRKAAEQGYAPAQASLGILYDLGQGVAQDYLQALSWYAKAAEQGDIKAQNNLGFMYSEGKGVVQDRVTAHMWFNIAGVGGNEDGRKNRDFVEKLMSPVQIADAQRRAGQWMSAHP